MIRLREILDTDLDILFENHTDAEAIQMAAFTHEDPADRNAFEAYWQRLRSDPDVVNRAIVSDDQILGVIGKFVIYEQAEVTYWIGRQYWGQGIATEALRQFVQIITERPLHARAAADNLASIRVMEKCGFSLIGTDHGFANARGSEIDEVVLQLD